MIVRIFTLKNGLEEYDDVQAIRIKSKDYNLLILKDYLPIIGKIEGNLQVEITEDDKVDFEDIVAYYINEKNIFNVMIEGK